MYHVNPRLAAQVFDGEYIIANLDTGLYYNIQGIAVALIDALPFAEPDTLIQRLSSPFPEQSAAIQNELSTLFKDLLTEEIILFKKEDPSAEPGVLKIPESYVQARFNRYADMQDLLLLDPIHDVDEEGWTVQNDNQ
jgi:hypothetical protein